MKLNYFFFPFSFSNGPIASSFQNRKLLLHNGAAGWGRTVRNTKLDRKSRTMSDISKQIKCQLLSAVWHSPPHPDTFLKF